MEAYRPYTSMAKRVSPRTLCWEALYDFFKLLLLAGCINLYDSAAHYQLEWRGYWKCSFTEAMLLRAHSQTHLSPKLGVVDHFKT